MRCHPQIPFYFSKLKPMRLRISDEIIEIARKHQNVNERIEIYWKAVLYAIEKQIIDERMSEYLDPNLRRSKNMMDKKNRLGHTKNKSGTDLNNKSGTHLKKGVGHTKNSKSRTNKKDISDDALTIYISNNNILYDIVYSYIHSNIHTGNIQYLVNKQWETKYIYSQMLEAEKIIKQIWLETFTTILSFIKQDDFRSKQILSIAKLNRKNSDGVPYYVVIMDKIKQYKPKVISIPTV